MKHLPKFILVGFLLILGSSELRTQDTDFNPLGRDIPEEELQKQLRIQVEWIELSHEDMTALLEEEDLSKPKVRKSSNDGPLREKLKKLIAEEKATLLETAVVVARSGQRAKVESIHEYIYPTEYDPPRLSTPGASDDEGADDDDDDEAADPSTAALPMAAAFETRNVGTTLEVDPVLGGDNRTIDLNLSPEIVLPVSETVNGHYESGKSKMDVKMPVFYTVKITTQVTVMAGEYLLMGTATPRRVDDGLPDFERKIMIFLKADLIFTGLPLEEED